MAARPISLFCKGLYWTLALAVGLTAAPRAGAKPKPGQKAAQPKIVMPNPAALTAGSLDPLTEWELINVAALERRRKTGKQPQDDHLGRQMAGLAVRSAVGAERALAIGNAALFQSYRSQYREWFHDTHWRLEHMATQGSRTTEYALGVVALHGYLASPAVDAACRHFLAALKRGYAGAKFRASQCVEKEDPARAAALLRDAADSGHPAAAELLGRACLEAAPLQAACAWERLTVAAAAGRPSAQSVLAWMYSRGVGGKADPARAAGLYLQAARAGDLSAQNNAGELYETGRGVDADLKVALDWYRKGAEAGFAAAQFNLGRLYALGNGTPRDVAAARLWLEKADAAGIAPARLLLDSIKAMD